jgi:hypothetical protein
MHKPIRLRFPRRRTYAKHVDDLYQADLVDLGSIANHNDGFRYLLTCIDVFSKRAWVEPLKTKSGREVGNALEKIMTESRPNFLQTDKGTEWLNATVQGLLRRLGVKFYTSENDDIKAAVVERFNRTLKSRMWRYFTRNNTRRFLDVLPDIVYAYNNSHHRSIGMKPTEVTSSNVDLVRRRLYPSKPRKIRWRYSVGDRVRISKQRRAFAKGYEGNWSEEIFAIATRHPTSSVTYGIRDLMGEDIKGKFYEQELQKIEKTDDVYKIEKILKTRKRNGRIEYFVKWLGYPEKFNSWVGILS